VNGFALVLQGVGVIPSIISGTCYASIKVRLIQGLTNRKPSSEGDQKGLTAMKRSMTQKSMVWMGVLLLALATASVSAQQRINMPRGNCYLNGITPGSNVAPTQPLTDAEKIALNEAIQDEYKSRATYNKILDTFGQVLPFANIVNAESRHVEALAFLHERYGVAIPADTWAEKVPAYATLLEAGQAAVQAEIDNGALYDRMLAKVSNPEVTNVFNALQFATMEHHLPAFQRLVAAQSGEPAVPRGQGRAMSGRGRGACCAAGACPVQQQGAGYGRSMGAGPGRGQGLGGVRQGRRLNSGATFAPGMGRGRGLGQGRAQGTNPYGPYNTAPAR